MAIELCAECIADVMNNPYSFYFFRNGNRSTGLDLNVYGRAAFLETLARGDKSEYEIHPADGSPTPSFTAITTVSGRRVCAFHAAERNWRRS